MSNQKPDSPCPADPALKDPSPETPNLEEFERLTQASVSLWKKELACPHPLTHSSAEVNPGQSLGSV